MNYELLERIRAEVISGMEGQDTLDDSATAHMIDSCLGKEELPLREKMAMKKELFNSLRRYDILSDLLDDPEISEVMVNGPSEIFYEKGGELHAYDRSFRDETVLENLIQQIVAGVNRHINEASPIVSARLKDGSRVQIVLPPIALDGATMTIRKFSQKKYTMKGLVEIGSITQEAADYLKTLVEAKYNIFICGGTGSGKTTLLNSLSEYIGRHERIITIEDSAELQINSCENIVRLESRNSNRDGTNAITIEELIRSALRMRPDRIIVGEVRGGEVIDMLQAMNTGHDGSLSTGHANSPKDMLRRLETMALMAIDMPLAAVRGQISSAIDILIQVSRLRDGSRRIISIEEIAGIKGGEIFLRPLFVFKEDGTGDENTVRGRLCYTGEKLMFREKLIRSGKKLGLEKQDKGQPSGGGR